MPVERSTYEPRFGLVVIFLCPDGPVLSAFGRCARGPNGFDPHAVECFKQVIQGAFAIKDGPQTRFPGRLELSNDGARSAASSATTALRKRTPPHGIIAAGFKSLHP